MNREICTNCGQIISGESAWEMFGGLEKEYGDAFSKKLEIYFETFSQAAGVLILLEHTSEEAIEIMQQIEKELKDE